MQWFNRRHGRGRPPHPDILTPAEWRVLQLLRGDLPNAEIADRLGVSVNTVRTHISSMLAKLELADRQALAAWEGQPATALDAKAHDTRLVALPGWLQVAGAGSAAALLLGASWLAFASASGNGVDQNLYPYPPTAREMVGWVDWSATGDVPHERIPQSPDGQRLTSGPDAPRVSLNFYIRCADREALSEGRGAPLYRVVGENADVYFIAPVMVGFPPGDGGRALMIDPADDGWTAIEQEGVRCDYGGQELQSRATGGPDQSRQGRLLGGPTDGRLP